ncbi:MAG TPA: hypothetical protein VM450_12775 [Thermomicrobiales bacterium]|nr:hypothetical protein [Thermomicrobiales bacterium]
MHNLGIPAPGRRFAASSKRALVIAAAALLLGGATPAILAAPVPQSPASFAVAQNVDWLSADQAALLSVGIDVLVPSWVPAPFDSVSPSISASDGYYELYWMVSGSSPTFLQVTGTAGGALPAGSPADLNKELGINDSVQGWPAIHDIGVPAGSGTPIYDQVWWQANGVLYSVSSLNMTGSDTMSLANSLVSLQVPSAPAQEPAPAQPVEIPTIPSEATGDNGPAVDEVPASVDTTQAQDTSSTDTQEADTQSVDQPAETDTSGTTGEEPAPASSGDEPSGPLPSDGTDGPRPPVTGGDGTGGTQDIILPRIPRQP